MPSPNEVKAALVLVTANAIDDSKTILDGTSGDPVERRLDLLNTVPAVISYYGDGAAALATDFYADLRADVGVKAPFTPAPTQLDRTVKIRRGIAWASEPLFDDDLSSSLERLSSVVQYETAHPFRDTILTNRQHDRYCHGWRRIAGAHSCAMCRMLADRGAVYKESTVRFATHDHCHCIAEPSFSSDGEPASVMQYVASRRHRTPEQRQALREYLADY